MNKYTVYTLQSDHNRHYIGDTSNLPQRVAQHNRKHKGFAGTTETWSVLCSVGFDNKTDAMKFEIKLKSLKDYNLAEEYIKKIQRLSTPVLPEGSMGSRAKDR